MKIYIIRNDQKDIQNITLSADKAIELVNKDKSLHCLPFDVEDVETNFKPMSDFGEREYNILHFTSEIKFGKHKGKQVGDLLYECPDYLQWAINNINLKLDEECLALLDDAMIKFKGEKK